jgi:sulfide:quinone oxidoreductase
VLILGGGIGGIVAANDLRRKLPEGHRVALVERNADHAFPPSFLWLMTGDRRPDEIRQPVAKLLEKGVEFVHGSVEGIDLTRQHVATTVRNIAYDYLIAALGAELAPDAVPGLKEGAETFYTLDGAARLRDVLSRFSGGRVAIVVASMPYKWPGA